MPCLYLSNGNQYLRHANCVDNLRSWGMTWMMIKGWQPRSLVMEGGVEINLRSQAMDDDYRMQQLENQLSRLHRLQSLLIECSNDF